MLAELSWTNAEQTQAIDRSHRIGQTEPVTAWRIIAAQTIDSRIAELIDSKAGLAARALDGSDDEVSLSADVQLEALAALLTDALRASSAQLPVRHAVGQLGVALHLLVPASHPLRVDGDLIGLSRNRSTMLILVPPSETKAFPVESPPVELGSLVLPELGPARARLVKALVRMARKPGPGCAGRAGLSESQAGELSCNRELLSAPTGAAAEVYTGVLYDALDLPALHQRGVATDQVLIFSGLWGVLRPGDRIPHYRCPAGVKLPALGSVSAVWRKALRAPLAAHAGDQLAVDLRSGAYQGLWLPGSNAVTVRVLHERESGGVVSRSVVSHFNKATKGRLIRALLESGQQPGKPDELADLVRALGYTVEPGPAGSRPDAPGGAGHRGARTLVTLAPFREARVWVDQADGDSRSRTTPSANRAGRGGASGRRGLGSVARQLDEALPYAARGTPGCGRSPAAIGSRLRVAVVVGHFTVPEAVDGRQRYLRADELGGRDQPG